MGNNFYAGITEEEIVAFERTLDRILANLESFSIGP
jgi:hypothetical protein